MSAYVSFFLKHNDDFIPLGDFCRSSVIFKTFDYYVHIPMEKIALLNKDTLNAFVEKCEKDITENKDQVAKIERQIQRIYNFSNEVSEKMEYIVELEHSITDYEQDIEELQYAIGYFDSLLTIRESDDKNDIYGGIEVPEKVTTETVVNV